MNQPRLNKFDQNKYTTDLILRQTRMLEKTQQFKVQANLLDFKEKHTAKICKSSKEQQPCLTPKVMSAKYLELMKTSSDSNQCKFQEPERTVEIIEVKQRISRDSVCERSRSVKQSYRADPLDSLVRFEGDSSEVKLDIVNVNPTVNLKQLFFDEQQPEWNN